MPQPAKAATAELCPLLPEILATAIRGIREQLDIPDVVSDATVLEVARAAVFKSKRSSGKPSNPSAMRAIESFVSIANDLEEMIWRVEMMRNKLFYGSRGPDADNSNANDKDDEVRADSEYPDDYEARAHDRFVRKARLRPLVDLDAEEQR